MTQDSALGRKLRKLRREPTSFFRDSKLAPLRTVGRVLGTLRPSAPTGAPKAKAPDAHVTGLDPARFTGTTREIVEASGLFDEGFYTTAYRDARHAPDPLGHYLETGVPEGRAPNRMFDPAYYVSEAGLEPGDDPLLHYILKGEAKGFRPRPDFDPTYYRTKNPDVADSGLGALEHYLEIGMREGRQSCPPFADVVSHRHDPEIDLRSLRATVVIPVYGGADHVRRCIESVFSYTTMPQVEVLVIDDASPDDETRALLDAYREAPRTTVLRNDSNLGFTRTVNRGIAHVGDRDVVLLNSDTVVAPRWLENLALLAYSTPHVASVTALSDNAGAFSTPEPGFNATAGSLAVYEAARLSQRAADEWAHQVPTGNGFCMYLRRAAIDAVGLFDEAKYPRGYGEENDWCMRAGDEGFRHLIALRSYVHHVNAASFGASTKAQRGREARAVLDRDHPDYGIQVKRGFRDGALERQRAVLRSELRVKRELPFPVRPRALFVVPNVTGGTTHTNRDLMLGVSSVYDALLLVSDSRRLQLFDYAHSHSKPRLLAEHTLEEPVRLVPHRSAEYDAVVSSWMVTYAVELMHVRHLGWHGLGLVRAAKQLNIPVVMSFHDFYAVCPSVNLTNGRDPFFLHGVTDPHVLCPLWEKRDAGGCEGIKQVDPEAFLRSWRRRIGGVLADCDAYVTTSATAKEILVENHPVLRERSDSFHVIPHGRDFDLFLSPPAPPSPKKPLRVLVPGNISESKGMHTLLELVELDETRREIELHTLGNVRGPLRRAKYIINHGPYKRTNFHEKVAEVRPHVGLIGSICPETYCHTLTECWSSGLPVVGSNLGAVGERIAKSGAGWTVDPLDARGLYQLLLDIRGGGGGWHERADAVLRWQQTEGIENTVAAMSSRYLDVYSEVRGRHRPLSPATRARPRPRLRERIALVVHGHYPLTRATTHVRIASQVHQSSGELDYDWISGPELLSSDVRDFDGVIVCRNAAAPAALSNLARRCALEGVPLVLDLDDDLLYVPSDKDPRHKYHAGRESIRALLATASLTTVSTEPLAERYAGMTREVRVVSNRLDARLWTGPIPGGADVPTELDLKAPLRVLYMGSKTHGEDLELVLPALDRLRRSHGVALHIAGVTGSPPPGVTLLRPPEERYDLFVRWLRSVAPHFDIAIAPLTDTPFNRSKSALKYMEYAVCGLPVVASRVEPYASAIHDGVDGFLAANDVDDWVTVLTRLADDGALRTRVAAKARSRAEAEFVAGDCVFDSLPWDRWRAELADAPAPEIES